MRKIKYDLQLYDISLRDFTFQFTGNSDRAVIPRGDHLLRSWQITTESPENATRFELLSLGSGDGADVGDVCPGAMPSKLRVGDTAIVITEPDPLRVRTYPPDGEQITQLYRDYIVPIVDGPVCANEIVWWRIELQNEQYGWVAEGAENQF